MTVVAGALLPDGALLAADCRITWQHPGGPFYTDTAQKIIKLGEAGCALGYSGDVRTFDYILPHIVEQLGKRPPEPARLVRWLPRFLRFLYRALARQYPIGPVELMVAGSFRGRPTRLSRRTILRTIEETHALEANNWLALRCLDQIGSCAIDRIVVPDSSEGFVMVMRSPRFTAEPLAPLSVAAIGSGRAAKTQLWTYAPLIMSARPDLAPHYFMRALDSYLVDIGEQSIGGMFLLAHAYDGKVKALCVSQPGPNGDGVEIRQEGYRFIVRNKQTGEEIVLQYPLELQKAPPTAPLVFDGLRQILQVERDVYRATQEEIKRRLQPLSEPDAAL